MFLFRSVFVKASDYFLFPPKILRWNKVVFSIVVVVVAPYSVHTYCQVFIEPLLSCRQRKRKAKTSSQEDYIHLLFELGFAQNLFQRILKSDLSSLRFGRLISFFSQRIYRSYLKLVYKIIFSDLLSTGMTKTI